MKVIDLKTTATQDIFENLNVIAYPNPFSNELNIQLELSENSKISIDLCDYTGRRITNVLPEIILTSGSYNFPVHIDVPSGYYSLKIVKAGKIYHKSVVRID